MVDEKFDPCPFCNSTDILASYTDKEDTYWCVAKCLTCGTQGPLYPHSCDNREYAKEEATKLWNKRPNKPDFLSNEPDNFAKVFRELRGTVDPNLDLGDF